MRLIYVFGGRRSSASEDDRLPAVLVGPRLNRIWQWLILLGKDSISVYLIGHTTDRQSPQGCNRIAAREARPYSGGMTRD
jgi:hypothetical protein